MCKTLDLEIKQEVFFFKNIHCKLRPAEQNFEVYIYFSSGTGHRRLHQLSITLPHTGLISLPVNLRVYAVWTCGLGQVSLH